MQNNMAEIIQKIAEDKDNIISMMLEYAPADTILFWNEKEGLSERQKKQWDPYIIWANEKIGAKFSPTEELSTDNTVGEITALESYLRKTDAKKLALAYLFARELKSVILGLAVVQKKCSVEDAFSAAFLEQNFQEEKWGTDEFSLEKSNSIKKVLNQLKNFI